VTAGGEGGPGDGPAAAGADDEGRARAGGTGGHLRVARDDGGVLQLHLDKPAKRNALDDDMVAGLIDEVEAAGRDEAVRCILLTGEGEHFCSGFDIVDRNAGSGPTARPRVGSIQRRLPSTAHRLIPLLCTTQVPIVAAARGWVAGIGLHLAAAADFLVVAEDARVWEPFSQRGFTPDSGATWLLPRLVGTARARELLLLGTAITGTTAVDWGLAHRAVPAAEVDATAAALAQRLASGPTVALGLTKWLLHTSAEQPLDAQLRDEAFAMELSSRSEDFREGLRAFLDKRDPRFTGR
jgi:2-(1,2-epoxy-1,2-dihydrophenyl)acetyl-CoA isomerase